MSVNDLQMKELQDQLEAEQYFSVSRSFDFEIFLVVKVNSIKIIIKVYL